MSKVFISYAREDSEVAERLYKDLIQLGAEPWMDKHDLYAGDGWRGAIKQAIRRSSHFIPLISQNSVRKRGYVQREIREALEVLKEIPPDEIYVIPVRIDDTVPLFEELREKTWVELFPSYADGLAKLRKSLAQSGGFDTKPRKRSLAASRDADRIRAYRNLFDRAAFQVPCVFEGTLNRLRAAIDDVSAAMATGSAYSRNDRLLMTIPPVGEFETDQFIEQFEEIRNSLREVKTTTRRLTSVLAHGAGKSTRDFASGHMEFFLFGLIEKRVPQAVVREAFRLMDQCDRQRNTIIKRINRLLEAGYLRKLPLMTLSSDQLVLSKDLEENEGHGTQNWDDYYLRLHKPLSEFLHNGYNNVDIQRILPTHIARLLKDGLGIQTVHDLTIRTADEIKDVKGVGTASVTKIQGALAKLGVSLAPAK